MNEGSGISGRMASLYDVFVDWEGRLGREMPGLTKRLEDAGARRVLDAGCGTGRHVAALLGRGFDAHGFDASEEMLERARAFVGEPERFHPWRLGDEPTAELLEAAPFDAVIALGNVWSLILTGEDVRGSCAAFHRLVRPGGLVLLGMKAMAIRRETGNPYLPLLKRERDGKPIWFVRFVDFDVPPLDDGSPVCDFHMLVVVGDPRSDEGASEGDAGLHRAGRWRIWSPGELEETFTAAGFENVKVSARLDDPAVEPASEDVYLHATVPGGRYNPRR